MSDAPTTTDATVDVTQDGLDAATATLETLLLELRGRGKSLPIGQLKMECLLDMMLPAGSDARLRFDYIVTTTAIEVARSMLAAARRAELMQR